MPLMRTYSLGGVTTTLHDEFRRRCAAPSDIREYLPLLYEVTRCRPGVRVLEIGVRGGNSTTALLAAADLAGGHVWSVDIADVLTLPGGMGPWRHHPAWTFTRGASTHPAVAAAQPAEVGILLIDAGHGYAETLAELRTYMPRLAPGGVALFHDTRLQADDGTFPVARALDDWCAETSTTWRDLPGRYGMGVIAPGREHWTGAGEHHRVRSGPGPARSAGRRDEGSDGTDSQLRRGSPAPARQAGGGQPLTGDLLVIVPSRGRPANAARLLERVHATRQLVTHVHVCADDDDPDLPAYRAVMAEAGGTGDVLEAGPRRSLAGWTNEIAVRRAAEYRYLASLGDDHVPRTPGWDEALCRAIEDMGGTGFAYPDDKRRADVPEAVVLSSDIVLALGWMCEPSLNHFRVDDVWADLGNGAGCLRYVPEAVVEHMYYAIRPDVPRDATYAEAEERGPADHAAYQAWRAGRMAADVETVRALGVATCLRHSL